MKAIFISTLLVAFSLNANAGFIDFEDTTDSGWFQSDIQSGDYQFDKNRGWMGVNNYSSWIPVGANNHTRDIEMGFGSFSLSRQDGAAFDLLSLDAGLSWYQWDLEDDLMVTGFLSTGGRVTSTLTLSHDYQSFDLIDFSGLDQVIFGGHATNSGYVALDNLQVNPYLGPSQLASPLPKVAPVPEPMMLPLFLLGLLGLIKFTRLSPGTCT